MLVKYYSRCALDVLLCSYFGISSLCGLVFDSIRSILRHVLFSFVNIYYVHNFQGWLFADSGRSGSFICSSFVWNTSTTQRPCQIGGSKTCKWFLFHFKVFFEVALLFFFAQLPRRNFNSTDLYLFAAEIWFKWINIISTFTENDKMHTMIKGRMGLITHEWSTYFGFLYSCIFPRKKLFWYQ